MSKIKIFKTIRNLSAIVLVIIIVFEIFFNEFLSERYKFFSTYLIGIFLLLGLLMEFLTRKKNEK